MGAMPAITIARAIVRPGVIDVRGKVRRDRETPDCGDSACEIWVDGGRVARVDASVANTDCFSGARQPEPWALGHRRADQFSRHVVIGPFDAALTNLLHAVHGGESIDLGFL